MKKQEDPRMAATRTAAMDTALSILKEDGVLTVTHAAIGEKTGISRSTLYRHWPKLEELRNAVFVHAATGPKYAPKTEGPLRADLTWLLGQMMIALNESDWGKVVPQIIAVAAIDDQAQSLINNWMKNRSENFAEVFNAAKARGDLNESAPIAQLIELGIAVPYFRKFIAGLPLDDEWLDQHVELICGLASKPE